MFEIRLLVRFARLCGYDAAQKTFRYWSKLTDFRSYTCVFLAVYFVFMTANTLIMLSLYKTDIYEMYSNLRQPIDEKFYTAVRHTAHVTQVGRGICAVGHTPRSV